MPRNKYIYNQSELKQGSEDWINFRKSGIGASEVSLLLGDMSHFWSTPYDLFLEKIGKSYKNFEPNDSMKRGTLLEPIARKFIKSYLNSNKSQNDVKDLRNKINLVSFHRWNFKQYTIRHKDHPFLMASFDGICFSNKVVLEIKCPSATNFVKLIPNGKIPKYYIGQVQSQLSVINSHFDISKGLFCNFNPDGVFHKKEENIKKLIIAETIKDEIIESNIISTCEKFWDMVESKKWNNNWNK